MHWAEAASFRANTWNPKLPTHKYKVRYEQSDFMNNSDELLIHDDQVCFISDMPLCLVGWQ